MRFRQATLALAVLFGAPGIADDTVEDVKFAPPQRIEADGKFVGAGRLYPSPVMHDVDGDKKLDILVGDLRGMVTVAPCTSAGKPVSFGAEVPLKNRKGQQLKFSNW